MHSRNQWGRRLASAAAALLLLAAPASAGTVPVEEEPMYSSFTYAVSRGKIYALESPAPYRVEAQVNAASLGAPLQEPTDLCVFDHEIYIADSAGNCVLRTDDRFQLLGILDRFVWQGKEETFSQPEGVSVTDEHIYIADTGNRRIVLCERGASFGYRNLVADMRSLLIMRELGYPVVFDATHSVQRPGGLGTGSGGDGKYAPALARAAVATGVDGIFMETHVNPKKALSDAANAIAFRDVKALWTKLLMLHEVVES